MATQLQIRQTSSQTALKKRKSDRFTQWLKDIKDSFPLFLMLLPAFLAILLFSYGPMFGLLIAFLDFDPFRGVFASDWVAWANFITIFQRHTFWVALNNTLLLNVLKLAISYPAAIVLALLLNEVHIPWFKKLVQTASIMPYFISWVVAATIFQNVFGADGIVNELLRTVLHLQSINFLSNPETFRWIIVGQDAWKYAGFSAVLYLAAMTTIDPALYEATRVDGANRWQQMWHITIPGIRFTMIVILILTAGWLVVGGFEQMLVMYNGAVYSTGDILETFSYRLGISENRYELATAVALFQSAISLILVSLANLLAKQFRQNSLF